MAVLLILGYGLIIANLFLDGTLHFDRSSNRLELGPALRDEVGAKNVLIAYGISLFIPILFAIFGANYDMSWMGWFGLSLMLGGGILCAWAARVNQFYYRGIVQADQYLCTEGPYKVLRHPGYLGSVLVWIGFGLTSSHWIVALLVSVIMGFSYWNRARREEDAMYERFSVDYQAYADETAAFIPFVY
ncbi:uncharacterized protein VTP21DRAFT_1415 [Calcarisporiella thermophila]|uniref:uncharacterized protein n=1 Tax=Calcarisporiella thermophila TaxID=911321 RepID=UPI0037446D10